MKMKQITKKSFKYGAERDQAEAWAQEYTWNVLGAVMRLT